MGNLKLIKKNVALENNSFMLTSGATEPGTSLGSLLDNRKSLWWRSTNDGPIKIEVTWASNQTLGGVALVFTNFVVNHTVKVDLFDAETSGNLLHSQEDILDFSFDYPIGFSSHNATSFPFGGGTHFSQFFDNISNVRRLDITINSTGTPVNPDGFLDISTLVCGEAYEFSVNPNFGVSFGFGEGTIIFRTEAGDRISNRSYQSRTMSMNLAHMESPDRLVLLNLLKSLGKHTPVFISLVPEESGHLRQVGQIYGAINSNSLEYIDYNIFGSEVVIDEI